MKSIHLFALASTLALAALLPVGAAAQTPTLGDAPEFDVTIREIDSQSFADHVFSARAQLRDGRAEVADALPGPSQPPLGPRLEIVSSAALPNAFMFNATGRRALMGSPDLATGGFQVGPLQLAPGDEARLGQFDLDISQPGQARRALYVFDVKRTR